MKNLIFQLKQLFMPFPEVGSWAYNRQVERYDQEMAKKPPGLKKDLETISESVKKIADAQREMLKATHTIQLCLCRLSEKENADEDTYSKSTPIIPIPGTVSWGHIGDDGLFKPDFDGPINITNIFGIDPDAIDGEPNSEPSE